jgi:xylulokinase
MSYLGLDLGGSSAKAAAFALDGSLLATAKLPYLLESPRPGWREFNPETQWQALAGAIRMVTSTAEVRHDPIRGIGISVAGEAVVPVAVDRTPLYNAFASFDTRGSEYVPLVRDCVGESSIFRITGQPLDGMYSLMRILWFRDHMPEVFRRTWKFCLWQELILLRLGLDPTIDYSNAARTMAFDIRAGEWSAQILRAVDVSSDYFASAVPQGTVIGSVSKQIADELGLPNGCSVVAGGLDQSCASLGLGVVDHATTAIGTGSVEAVDIPLQGVDDLRPEADQFLFLTPYSAGGFLATAHHLTAGSAIAWHRSLVGSSSFDDLALYGAATGANLGLPSSLLVLPQFAGSFAPRRNPATRAAIIGLSLDTSATDIARALLESLVFELRVTVESMEAIGLQVGQLRNGGGGCRSELWMRLKATVLGRPIAVPDITDSSCLGAAILAAGADGVSDTSSVVATMVRMKREYDPESSVSSVYDDRYHEYRSIRESWVASDQSCLVKGWG